ncbi:alpha-L-arabinofuranosidase C-terminal domain-containing protein [Balneolales bacterium ANBcel1]|nr:alpha-L-arabinofuranosidase C-terminal domain-containing protein [Balneolales bacterium ANBcel1]
MLLISTSAIAQNRITVSADEELSKIDRHIYGHFAEHLGTGIYGGVWVGEDSDIPNTDGIRTDVLEALKKLEIPNIRWPGGCFADEYYWKDGIGPREDRPKRINTHWGMVIEDNSFGTHEFLRFTELLGAEPVIAMNVGSGTPREMQQWLEYMNYDGDSEMANLRRKNGREDPWGVKYIGVGNESWGCGGNMRPEYYADLYRRFATYTREYSGHELFRVASGFDLDKYWWTDTLMERAGDMMEGLSLHYYTVAGPEWEDKGPSMDFDEDRYFIGVQKALWLDRFIEGHSNRMDRHDPEKRVALVVDEWGIWTDPLPDTNPGFLQQQNSLRDALIASVSLDILNKHSDRVRMANIAQMVNVLQAVILTDGEEMLLTPTYHIFDMYRVHFDATLLHTHGEISDYEYNDEQIPTISHTISKSDDGRINITITNLHAREAQIADIDIRGQDVRRVTNGRLLTADEVDSINTFDNPDNVAIRDFTDYNLRNNRLSMTLPAKSVVVVTME